jgi:outer membrane protein assembly factor BamD
MGRFRHSAAFGFALWLVLILLLSCSDKAARMKGLTDADLLARALDQASRNKHAAAADAFRTLLERHPTSPLAARAQLGLAEAQMARKDFVDAEASFDDFLRLFPASDNVPYALSRKAETLRRQVGPPGRDQSRTREAIRIYEALIAKDPKGPYRAEADARIRELRDRLAEHEKMVVAHYLKRRKPESAEARARRAVADHPDAAALPILMTLLAEALERQNRDGEAAEIRGVVAERFPGFGAKTK